MAKKMTKAIRELVEKANESMQVGTLEDNNKLYIFVENILLKKGMYHGYNTYFWATLPDGTKWLKLIGSDDAHRDERGIFHEQPTDIRQFYLD